MTLPASYFEDSAEFERKVCLEIPKLIILEETMPRNTFEEYFQSENVRFGQQSLVLCWGLPYACA